MKQKMCVIHSNKNTKIDKMAFVCSKTNNNISSVNDTKSKLDKNKS